jgi:5-methylcytosine-specific restriction endonuclease McrA
MGTGRRQKEGYMPDRDVSTIRDLIYYQYAKLIARSAFRMPDGRSAKGAHYGFIKRTFQDLKSGRKQWSAITREDKQLVEAPHECAYCGSKVDLQWEHIIPRSIAVLPRCATCDKVQGIHNQIWGCRTCNASKGTLGLYGFFRRQYPTDRKYYDRIPPLLEKKYLKTIHDCHECAGTIDSGDLDGDGEITVLDLDEVIYHHGP